MNEELQTLGGKMAELTLDNMLWQEKISPISSEKTLQGCQWFMERFADAMPGLIYIYDVNENRNIYVNQQTNALLGYTPAEIQQFGSDLVSTLMHPDDLAKLPENMATIAMLKDSEVFEWEYRLKHAKGEWRWFLSRDTIFLKNPDESVKQILGTAIDISDRKQAQEKLRQKTQELETVFQALPDLYFRLDAQGTYLACHAGRSEDLYLQPEQFLGKQVLEVMPAEVGQQVCEAIAQVLKSQELVIIEYALSMPEGEKYFEARLLPLAEQQVMAVVRNITEKKQSEAKLQQVKDSLAIEVQQRTAELSRLNQQLQEREEQFRQLAENIKSVFWMTELDKQRMIYVSPAYEKIWGLSCAQLYASPQSFLEVIHPEDSDRIIAALDKQALGEYDEEYRIIGPDGSIRWIRDRAFPVHDELGRVYRIAGIAEDISDQKQAQIIEAQLIASLQERERQLQTIVTNLLDALLIVDLQGRVLFANPGAGKLFGYKPEDLIGYELGWPIVEGEKTELTILRQGGEIGVGEMYVAPAAWEGQSVSVVSLRDITLRRRAEQALRDSEERFRQLAEHIDNVFWLASFEENQLLYLSPAYEQIWGCGRDRLSEDIESWIDAVHPEDQPAAIAVKEQQRAGESTSQEYRIVRPDGSIRWIWERTFPVKDELGRVYRIAGIAEDISDRKVAEAQIQASLQEKETLLKEIHHRVKNNMQVISSLLELQAQCIGEPQTLALFQESQNRIRSMALIHEQLYRSLHLNQIDFAKYIKDLATNLFQVFRGQSNAIELKLNVVSTSLNLETAIPCGLIVNELVSNSLKHAFPEKRKGEITIEFTRVNSVQFHLIVSDNGLGLPANFDREPTETLGWRLVRMLTRQLKGILEIEQHHRGAKFKITFSELKYRRRV